MESLEVSGPYLTRTYELNEAPTPLTIGRENFQNYIELPDPQKNVSRRHCVLEKDAHGYWWVLDNSSANGTYHLRGPTKIDVQQTPEKAVRLFDGDVILILSELSIEGTPIPWRLTFKDSGEATNKLPFGKSGDTTDPPPTTQLAYLEYSISQNMLYEVTGQNRRDIQLSPKERQMVHYMAERNQANGGSAVLCNYKELIGAIWDSPFGHMNDEVNHLVFRLRHKIEPEPGEPRFVKTVPGKGYLLDIRVLP
ncbi:MAG: winged helix-turn-helix domain-containing protein [Oscillatoria sp. Prado101]|jgi:DNA-binding winged helix-turn-helix (wHTH) protein|nr:winged helix-turn-helix domain-containing protein [Oscillatoria sp. Prado101]